MEKLGSQPTHTNHIRKSVYPRQMGLDGWQIAYLGSDGSLSHARRSKNSTSARASGTKL